VTATVVTPTGRTRYWPALDGVRAIGVLLVVAYHLAPATIDRGGTIGVTMFFTLSGFLITSLLLSEADRTGTVSLGRFYVRRALRLLPALFVLVAVVGAYASISGRDDDTLSAAPAVLLYVGNWVRAFGGFNTLGMFEHAWSLAVEEQFYLAWPLAVLAVTALAGRRNRAVAVLVAATVGSIGSLVLRLMIWDDHDPIGSAARVLNGTDAVADQLLVGCGLAAGLHIIWARRSARETPFATPAFRAASAVLGPAALAFLVWVSVARPGGASAANNRLYLTWGATAFTLAAAVLVLVSVVDERSALSRVLTLAPLVAIGRVSYGLYLWHFPVLLAVQSEMADSSVLVQRLLTLVLSAVATFASWRLVEQPALRLKERFQAPRGAADATAPPLAADQAASAPAASRVR
jgi:peptidoglycan/LPS O-acetylase OafA/YrhL